MKRLTFTLTATIAAIFAVSAFAQQSERPEEQVDPLLGNPQAIAAGRATFGQSCAVCHGPTAQGDRGPSLVNGNLPHGNADGQIFNSIRGGIPGTAMQAYTQLSSDQIWQIIAFLRDLAGVKPPAPGGAQTLSGNTAAGKAIFEGKGGCVSCHTVNGVGKPVGPDLSSGKDLAADAILNKIKNPNAAPAAAGGRGGGRGGPAGPASVTVTTKDGKTYRGVRKAADTLAVSFVDTDGVFRSFDKASLAKVEIANTSLMPADFSTRLTADEINNVAAYVKSLSPDPAKMNDGPQILSWDRIKNSTKEPQNFPMYWGDLRGTHYSTLNQINSTNVKNLELKWTLATPGSGSTQAQPVVVDGILYTTGPVVGQQSVFAADARTGRQLWRFDRKQTVTSPNQINPSNRGVTLAGNRLFYGTLDGSLVALDARVGKELWEVKVGDPMLGQTITSPPLAIKNLIITGVSGGEFGINGYIDAYDQVTGKRVWRLNTVPQKGEPNYDTWGPNGAEHGAAPTWLTGTYDPEADTLFWPTGNPGPDYNGAPRPGDNLYSDSVLAIDPNTGKMKWYYQFTPHDTHDWDSTENMILVDRVLHGQNRKLLLHADRNGVFYVLDRTNGKLVVGAPFVRASWLNGFDANGHPNVLPNSASAPEGNVVSPAVGGGTNFQGNSYNPLTGFMYLEYNDTVATYASADTPYEAGKQYSGRGAGGRGAAPAGPPPAPNQAGIAALDPETMKAAWKFELNQGSLSSGLTTTAGNLVLAATPEGNFMILDAKTGALLWHFTTGIGIATSPISYSVNGKQYIAVACNATVYGFALPD